MRTVVRFCKLVVSVVRRTIHMVMLAASYAGFVNPPKDAIYRGERIVTTPSSTNKKNSYMFITDGATLVPVPIPLVTDSIKRQLPIVCYDDYCKMPLVVGSPKTNCAVCWDSIGKSDEMRELCNCEHVFHRECLDRWLDECQVTCPLCRSMLLPSHTNPWMLLKTRNEYVIGHF